MRVCSPRRDCIQSSSRRLLPGLAPHCAAQPGNQLVRPARASQRPMSTAEALLQAQSAGKIVPQTSRWVFGFGSLISNPGFEHSEKVPACFIKGWKRVFYQGSTDHRGVPEAPGRTVTLVECEGAVTWGAAYELVGDAQQRRRTLEYLEWREKQYDLRLTVPVYTADSPTQPVLTAVTYVATSDRNANPNWLGSAPLDDIAAQIATAVGPSGPNYAYLFNLADAMRAMGVTEEDELFELEARVKALLQGMDGRRAAIECSAHLGRSGSDESMRSDGTQESMLN